MKKNDECTKCISSIKELQAATEHDKLDYDVSIAKVFIKVLELGYYSNGIRVNSNIKNVDYKATSYRGINNYQTLSSLIIALKDKNKLIPWYGNDIISLLMRHLLNSNSNSKPAFPSVENYLDLAKCTNRIEYIFPKDAKLPRTNVEEVINLLASMGTRHFLDTLHPLLTCVVSNEPNT